MYHHIILICFNNKMYLLVVAFILLVIYLIPTYIKPRIITDFISEDERQYIMKKAKKKLKTSTVSSDMTVDKETPKLVRLLRGLRSDDGEACEDLTRDGEVILFEKGHYVLQIYHAITLSHVTSSNMNFHHPPMSSTGAVPHRRVSNDYEWHRDFDDVSRSSRPRSSRALVRP